MRRHNPVSRCASCRPQRRRSTPLPHAEQGVRLFPCATRLAEQPALAGLKHLNRLEQVLARAEWQDADCAEGLMRDSSGRVIEGVYSNLFLVVDAGLVTADLSRCGVAGVMRAEILQQARCSGYPSSYAIFPSTNCWMPMKSFSATAFTASGPVRALQERHWSVGPLTRKLQAIVCDLLSK
jgi:4-amino-4-deoxychorismate lyase